MALASSACAPQSMNATQEMNQCVSPGIWPKARYVFYCKLPFLSVELAICLYFTIFTTINLGVAVA
jgi:hypothetical protein